MLLSLVCVKLSYVNISEGKFMSEVGLLLKASLFSQPILFLQYCPFQLEIHVALGDFILI